MNQWKYFNPKFEYEEKFQAWKQPWAGHMYFVYDLIRNLNPKVIVELGTYVGVSFFTMCQAVKDGQLDTKLHAVDTWKGDEQTRFYDESIFDLFSKLKRSYYNDLNIILHRKTFDQALEEFPSNSIDFLHIDGLHTYKAVKHDFTAWNKKVKKGGVIFLHDTHMQRAGFEVYKLWEEIKGKNKTLEFSHSYGLGILFKTPDKFRKILKFQDIWQHYYSLKVRNKRNSIKLKDCKREIKDLENIVSRKDIEVQKQEVKVQKQEVKIQKQDKEIKIRDTQIHEMVPDYKEFQAFKKGLIWRTLIKYRLGKSIIIEVLKHPSKILKAFGVLLNEGPYGVIQRIRRIQGSKRYFNAIEDRYRFWVGRHALSEAELDKQRILSKELKYRPKISIITPVYNTEERWLIACIESIRKQTYDNWELCLADDASTKPYIKDILKKFSQQDPRIKVVFRKQNGHICRSSNSALKLATGEYVGLLDHDDEIAPQALFRVVEVLNRYPNTDFIYSDEDKLELDGRRVDPHFKPGWSPDKLYSFMYAGHLSIYRKEIIDKLRGFRPGLEGSQDYDLLLRASKIFKRVYHIEDMLYHWRKLEDSTALTLKAKPYALLAGKRALQEDLKSRVKSDYQVDYTGLGYYIVNAEISKNQKVDIFIKGENTKVLKALEKSLNNRIGSVGSYNSIEELNRLLDRTGSDFSVICNDAEAVIKNPKKTFNFVGYLNVDKVSIIGSKILDREDKILSAGLILSQERVRTPFYKNNDFAGYSNNLITPSNYYGIDSGLFAIDNHIFKKVVKKFDPKLEQLFVLDASIKLWKHHYRTVFWPLLKIRTTRQICYDSPSVREEYELIVKRYKGDDLLPDTFYNSNFSLGENLFEID